MNIQLAANIVALLLVSGAANAFNGGFHGAAPQVQPRMTLGAHKAPGASPGGPPPLPASLERMAQKAAMKPVGGIPPFGVAPIKPMVATAPPIGAPARLAGQPAKPVVAVSQPIAKPALPPRPPAKPVVAVGHMVKPGVAPLPPPSYPAKPARVPPLGVRTVAHRSSGTAMEHRPDLTGTAPPQPAVPQASNNNDSRGKPTDLDDNQESGGNPADLDDLLAFLDHNDEETRALRPPPRSARTAPRSAVDTAAPPPSSEEVGAGLDALLQELTRPVPPATATQPMPPATAEEKRMVDELLGELDAQQSKIEASRRKRRLPVLGQRRQEAVERRAQLASHKARSEGDLQSLREARAEHKGRVFGEALSAAKAKVQAGREARRERPGRPSSVSRSWPR